MIPEDVMEQLTEALDGLWKEAEVSYCRGLDRLQRPECLGWEAKVKNGTFGRTEFEAHRNAKELIGRHFGIAHAVKTIRAILTDREARSGWRDIASAPKDGTQFIAFDGRVQQIVKWGSLYLRTQNEDLYGWTVVGDPGRAFRATYWMPMPAAPSEARQPEAYPAIPAGYKLVPVEPTGEMMQAGQDRRNANALFDLNDAYHVYCAMIGASPSREETEGGDEYSRGVRDVVTFLHEQAEKEVSKSGKTSLNSIANLIGNTFKASPKPDTSALLLEAEKAQTDHARGCQGREYTCTCGYDDARDATISELVGLIERAQQNTPEHFSNWHDAARSTLSKIRGGE